MKIIVYGLKYVMYELIIIFGLVLLINNYIGNVDQTIKADAIGYYDYLPSTFIHHDLNRKNDSIQENPSLYQRINSTGVYVDYNNFKVNKYPCGTALLQLPFFTYTYLTTNLEGGITDGYQKPFQKTVFYAAIFYLILSMFFLKEILLLYDIKRYIIVFCQLILVLATPLTNYVNYDAGFSHVYSLFAVTAFIYFITSFLLRKKLKHFVLASLFLGLIVILRQPNILIVLFIPFLAGSKETLQSAFKTLLNNFGVVVLGLVLFLGIVSLQLIAWYLQTGNFLVYSYQGEGFNFLDPYFFSILFSYRKGLFIYTPVLLIAAISVIWFVIKKQFYLFFTWTAFFVLLTYILSSWWSWFYGGSYGLRAYIDYYVIFLIPFAMVLQKIKMVPRLIVITLSILTIPLNIVQTYQYKEYILHMIEMNKEIYWSIFLKTDDAYKGLYYRGSFDENLYSTLSEINIGDVSCPKESGNTVFMVNSSDIPDFDKVSVIQVLADNDYEENNDTRVVLAINRKDESHNYYWHSRYLLHFHQKQLNEWQTGLYNFEFDPITDNEEKEISLGLITGKQNELLQNVRIKFLRKSVD